VSLCQCCGAEGVKLFKILTLSFNVSSMNDQSFADASSSSITKLLILMPMACQEQELKKPIY